MDIQVVGKFIKNLIINNEFFLVSLLLLASFILNLRLGLENLLLFLFPLISLFFTIFYYISHDYIQNSYFTTPVCSISPFGNSLHKARILSLSTGIQNLVLLLFLTDIEKNYAFIANYAYLYLVLLQISYFGGIIANEIIPQSSPSIKVQSYEGGPKVQIKITNKHDMLLKICFSMVCSILVLSAFIHHLSIDNYSIEANNFTSFQTISHDGGDFSFSMIISNLLIMNLVLGFLMGIISILKNTIMMRNVRSGPIEEILLKNSEFNAPLIIHLMDSVLKKRKAS